MTLSETATFFEKLETTATKKSQRKLYKSFITILNNLQQRELDAGQVAAIEKTLEDLDLTTPSKNTPKFYRKKLTEFTEYLRKEFSLIPHEYYMNKGIIYGMIFGMSIGLSLGTAFGATGTSMGLSMGIGIGMALGMVFGTAKDKEAKKQNRVLG